MIVIPSVRLVACHSPICMHDFPPPDQYQTGRGQSLHIIRFVSLQKLSQLESNLNLYGRRRVIAHGSIKRERKKRGGRLEVVENPRRSWEMQGLRESIHSSAATASYMEGRRKREKEEMEREVERRQRRQRMEGRVVECGLRSEREREHECECGT